MRSIESEKKIIETVCLQLITNWGGEEKKKQLAFVHMKTIFFCKVTFNWAKIFFYFDFWLQANFHNLFTRKVTSNFKL